MSCSTNPQKQPAANATNRTQPAPRETIRREKGPARKQFCKSALLLRACLRRSLQGQAQSFPSEQGGAGVEAEKWAPGSNAGAKGTPRPGPADREGLRKESERQQWECETWHTTQCSEKQASFPFAHTAHRPPTVPRSSLAHRRCSCGTMRFLHQRVPSWRGCIHVHTARPSTVSGP